MSRESFIDCQRQLRRKNSECKPLCQDQTCHIAFHERSVSENPDQDQWLNDKGECLWRVELPRESSSKTVCTIPVCHFLFNTNLVRARSLKCSCEKAIVFIAFWSRIQRGEQKRPACRQCFHFAGSLLTIIAKPLRLHLLTHVAVQSRMQGTRSMENGCTSLEFIRVKIPMEDDT
jgi:hypothetical protein